MKRRTRARLRDLANCALLLLAAPALGATIDAVRVEQTRVIFDVSAPVTFQVFTLTDPHRVVVDLERTHPRSGVDVSDAQSVGGDVTGVRGGPRGSDGYRVVLDVQSPADPNGFLMAPDGSNGDRLVVDLHGPARMTAVKTAPRASTSPTGQAPRKFVVAIDAGHGGEDPGAIGVGQIQEKRIALAIAKELARLFSGAPGYRGELTRKDDYYLTLRQRTTVARNERADLFVSIHADAYRGADARGASVYTLSAKGATSETARWLAEKENASDLIGGAGDVSLDDKDALLAHVLLDLSMDANRSASIEAGGAVLGALGGMTQLHRTHVEQAGFVVLKSPDIPSILVETGYLSNPGEARKLAQSAYQRTVARAIFNGVMAYVARHPPSGTAVESRQRSIGASERVIKSRDAVAVTDIAGEPNRTAAR